MSTKRNIATVKGLIKQLKIIERMGHADAPILIEIGENDYHQIFCLSGAEVDNRFIVTIETFNENSVKRYKDNQDKVIHDDEAIH